MCPHSSYVQVRVSGCINIITTHTHMHTHVLPVSAAAATVGYNKTLSFSLLDPLFSHSHFLPSSVGHRFFATNQLEEEGRKEEGEIGSCVFVSSPPPPSVPSLFPFLSQSTLRHTGRTVRPQTEQKEISPLYLSTPSWQSSVWLWPNATTTNAGSASLFPMTERLWSPICDDCRHEYKMHLIRVKHFDSLHGLLLTKNLFCGLYIFGPSFNRVRQVPIT